MRIFETVAYDISQQNVEYLFHQYLSTLEGPYFVRDGKVFEILEVHHGSDLEEEVGNENDPRFAVQVAAFKLRKAIDARNNSSKSPNASLKR